MMSVPHTISVKCSVCGKSSKQTILLSSNRFGAPDLDLRPPQMMRGTMCWWIQECPHCGYVAKSLDDKTNVTAKWLQSAEYRACNDIDFSSPLAKRFYRHYLISEKQRNVNDAFYAALHAAWACDDTGDTENAVRCRTLALNELEKMIASGPSNEDFLVLKADLLRRTGAFEALIEEYQNKAFSSDLLNRIIAFQIAKAKLGDTACYTVADVEE
ncbi:MAG: DUF2225 domain-containing protein [Clostridia bacterium]|nr:DUF2225 domain-containing protein [Clostridia bacterium]